MKYLTKRIVRRLIIIDFLLLCVVLVLFMKTAIYKLIFIGIITYYNISIDGCAITITNKKYFTRNI